MSSNHVRHTSCVEQSCSTHQMCRAYMLYTTGVSSTYALHNSCVEHSCSTLLDTSLAFTFSIARHCSTLLIKLLDTTNVLSNHARHNSCIEQSCSTQQMCRTTMLDTTSVLSIHARHNSCIEQLFIIRNTINCHCFEEYV